MPALIPHVARGPFDHFSIGRSCRSNVLLHDDAIVSSDCGAITTVAEGNCSNCGAIGFRCERPDEVHSALEATMLADGPAGGPSREALARRAWSRPDRTDDVPEKIRDVKA